MLLQAELRVLQDGQEKSITAELVQPKRLVPVHIQNHPPTYFIIAGLVFTQVPGLSSGFLVLQCRA